VLAVVVHAFEPGWLPFGFVGVDILFAISGYLAGASLLDDLDCGSFSIPDFWQRRIARVAPSLFLVIAATLVAAWLIYSDPEFAWVGSAAAYASVSALNLKLMLGGAHFAASRDAEPLLHLWAVSVWAQFCLLIPFYLYAVTRWTRRPVAITFLLAVASLALFAALIVRMPNWAFYLLPTRGWEFLAGVLAAMLRRRGVRLSLPPLLGHSLPAGVGKRALALYLWHRPVFSFVDYQLFATDFWIRAAIKIALLAVLAWATHRFVRVVPGRRWPAFGGLALAMAAMFATGTAIRQNWYLDPAPSSLASGGITAGQGKFRVVLLGDSQATMYARDLARLARERSFTLNILAMPGAGVIKGVPGSHWEAVETYLAGHHADAVIFAELWDHKLKGAARIGATLDALDRLGVGRTFIVLQPPLPHSDRRTIREGERPPFRERPAVRRYRLRARSFIAFAAAGRDHLIDIEPLFLKPDGSIDLVGPRGRLTHLDAGHLSEEGARKVIPLLDRLIAFSRADP
jgi:peptidoglycan/LPS O-acetylase OafA/YrhL